MACKVSTLIVEVLQPCREMYLPVIDNIVHCPYMSYRAT